MHAFVTVNTLLWAIAFFVFLRIEFKEREWSAMSFALLAAFAVPAAWGAWLLLA